MFFRGTNKITKVAGNTDELRLNTTKGNTCLIVGVAGKNGTSISISHLNVGSMRSGKIPQCQTGVMIHVRLMQNLVEQARAAEYPAGHKTSVTMHGIPLKGLRVQRTETHTLRTIAPCGCSGQFLTETKWKGKHPTNIFSDSEMLEIFCNRHLVILKDQHLNSTPRLETPVETGPTKPVDESSPGRGSNRRSLQSARKRRLWLQTPPLRQLQPKSTSHQHRSVSSPCQALPPISRGSFPWPTIQLHHLDSTGISTIDHQ